MKASPRSRSSNRESQEGKLHAKARRAILIKASCLAAACIRPLDAVGADFGEELCLKNRFRDMRQAVFGGTPCGVFTGSCSGSFGTRCAGMFAKRAADLQAGRTISAKAAYTLVWKRRESDILFLPSAQFGCGARGASCLREHLAFQWNVSSPIRSMPTFRTPRLKPCVAGL